MRRARVLPGEQRRELLEHLGARLSKAEARRALDRLMLAFSWADSELEHRAWMARARERETRRARVHFGRMGRLAGELRELVARDAPDAQHTSWASLLEGLKVLQGAAIRESRSARKPHPNRWRDALMRVAAESYPEASRKGAHLEGTVDRLRVALLDAGHDVKIESGDFNGELKRAVKRPLPASLRVLLGQIDPPRK